jgi:hypothetical protein
MRPGNTRVRTGEPSGVPPCWELGGCGGGGWVDSLNDPRDGRGADDGGGRGALKGVMIRS